MMINHLEMVLYAILKWELSELYHAKLRKNNCYSYVGKVLFVVVQFIAKSTPNALFGILHDLSPLTFCGRHFQPALEDLLNGSLLH